MEEFAKFAPLDLDEIDDLYARIKAFRNDAARPTVSAPEPLP
jgi:hypothetical protein